MGFLVDTCIWVDVERGAMAPGDVARVTGEDPIYISPVTIAELKFGADIAPAGIREKRLAALARLMRKPLLRMDEVTGEIFGSLTAQLHIARRTHTYRVQDLWLAAQAVQHGIHLLTHNRKDFADIPGLDLVIWREAVTRPED